jgi:hypothetical protein
MGRVCFAKEKRQSGHSGAVAVQRVLRVYAILTGHALRGVWPLANKGGLARAAGTWSGRQMVNRFINIY